MKKQKDKANKTQSKSLFKKVRWQEIESLVARYLNEPSIQNTLELIQIIHENTVHEILSRLASRKQVIKRGREVFGSDGVFLDYLFETPLALGRKMPIHFFTNAKGAQIIMDELLRMEYGILS